MLCYVRSTYETHMSVKEISHMPGISNTFSCLRRHWRFKETLSDWEPAPLITTVKKVVETHWKPKCIHFSSNPNDLQKKKKKKPFKFVTHLIQIQILELSFHSTFLLSLAMMLSWIWWPGINVTCHACIN